MEQNYPQMFLPDSNIDRRKCKREVPMEVLNLGFPRTGTACRTTQVFETCPTTLLTCAAAMRLALDILEIPCYHGFLLYSNIRDCDMWIEALDAKFQGKGKPFQRADWDQLLGSYSAVADVPAVAFAEDLIEAYPEAKVVLVERDVENWYKSFDDALINESFNPVLLWISKFDPRYTGRLKRMAHGWING